MNTEDKNTFANELATAICKWLNGNISYDAEYNGESVTYEDFLGYCGNFSLAEVVENAGSEDAAALEYINLYY